MFFAHISVLLVILVLITFRSSFGEFQKSNMVDPRWPPFENYDVITSSLLVVDLKGNILERSIFLLYLRCFLEGGGGGAIFPGCPS